MFFVPQKNDFISVLRELKDAEYLKQDNLMTQPIS